jgi:hypothetical protein
LRLNKALLLLCAKVVVVDVQKTKRVRSRAAVKRDEVALKQGMAGISLREGTVAAVNRKWESQTDSSRKTVQLGWAQKGSQAKRQFLMLARQTYSQEETASIIQELV